MVIIFVCMVVCQMLICAILARLTECGFDDDCVCWGEEHGWIGQCYTFSVARLAYEYTAFSDSLMRSIQLRNRRIRLHAQQVHIGKENEPPVVNALVVSSEEAGEQVLASLGMGFSI